MTISTLAFREPSDTAPESAEIRSAAVSQRPAAARTNVARALCLSYASILAKLLRLIPRGAGHSRAPGAVSGCALAFLSLLPLARGQGIFIYDQQSANESSGGGGFIAIQSNQPIGQSFTPTNSSIGFIRLEFSDSILNGSGATVYVNLLSNSITGVILGKTDPIFMPDGFGVSSRGFTNFLFSTPIPVTPGVTYYFEPVVQSGDTSWAVLGYHYLYPGGTAFFNGLANSGNDLWFREGVNIVPEPSSLSLLIGSGVLFYVGRKKIKMRSIS